MDDLFPNFPTDFGRYRILRKLGKGGMGTVYLADDTKLRNRKTAIKIPKEPLGAEGAARFRREAEASAMLKHENICNIYDIGEISGQPYMAMVYVEGVGLELLVGASKRWSVERAVPFVMKLCDAFQYAHERGIIHRDIKPANIIVQANDEPMVLDFGLTKIVGDPTITTDGSTIGTISYMPNEQADGDLTNIKAHSDIYSLGVVLFELLTGERPYLGDPVKILKRLVSPEPTPSARSRLPTIPEAVNAVCSKATAKEWKDRYCTMREFRTALAMSMQPHPIITSVETTVLVPGVPSTPAAPSPAPRKAGERLELLLPGDVPLTMAWCPPGAFRMGSDKGDNDEKPVHTVTLTQGFWMGIYPVTQAQWQAVMGNNPSYFKGPNRPVEQVSWDDAMQFIVKASKAVGQEFRLPTEAQWEYACRAGSTTEYCNGDDEASLRRVGWFDFNSNGVTHPVGELQPNAWGLYDCHGNVWEWCNDWFDANAYARSDCTDPTGPSSASARVLRGGCWIGNGWICRSAIRNRYVPSVRYDYYGFRLAAVPVVGAR